MRITLIYIALMLGVLMVAGTPVDAGTKRPAKIKIASAQKVTYTCPMHPEVTSAKPGSCPKCGMTLVKKMIAAPKVAKTRTAALYRCPMDPEVTSTKPDKCNKCGMALEKTGADPAKE